MYGSRTDKSYAVRINEDARIALPRHIVKAAVAQAIAHDLMDVTDEQAIAADGITEARKPSRAPFTTESPLYNVRTAFSLRVTLQIGARVDADKKAKVMRRRDIEADMAKGVRFPDLDPYTLEPIRVSHTGSLKASNVRPARRRYF